ncbi:MAG: non-heme iron oxygenase ferredoxin subunit [Gammaproteobacteria bacterium]
MTDSQWVDAAAVDDIGPGTMACVDAGPVRVLICNVAGTFHAVAEMCSHEDYPLCIGALQGETVKCSLHGSRFKLTDGAPLDEPADQAIAVYPVRVDGNRILVQV